MGWGVLLEGEQFVVAEKGEDFWSKSVEGDGHMVHWGMGWKDGVSIITGEEAVERVQVLVSEHMGVWRGSLPAYLTELGNVLSIARGKSGEVV